MAASRKSPSRSTITSAATKEKTSEHAASLESSSMPVAAANNNQVAAIQPRAIQSQFAANNTHLFAAYNPSPMTAAAVRQQPYMARAPSNAIAIAPRPAAAPIHAIRKCAALKGPLILFDREDFQKLCYNDSTALYKSFYFLPEAIAWVHGPSVLPPIVPPTTVPASNSNGERKRNPTARPQDLHNRTTSPATKKKRKTCGVRNQKEVETKPKKSTPPFD